MPPEFSLSLSKSSWSSFLSFLRKSWYVMIWICHHHRAVISLDRCLIHLDTLSKYSANGAVSRASCGRVSTLWPYAWKAVKKAHQNPTKDPSRPFQHYKKYHKHTINPVAIPQNVSKCGANLCSRSIKISLCHCASVTKWSCPRATWQLGLAAPGLRNSGAGYVLVMCWIVLV